MASAELKSKILEYLEQVGIATRNEIMKATNKSGKTLTIALEELVKAGAVELVSENPLTYRIVRTNVVIVDLNDIKSYYDLKFEIFRKLRSFGWRVSTHEIVAIALMYAKFTKFRILVFGSQGAGKTSLIQAVFGKIGEPIVVQDLHLKNLYDVVRSVKERTKVIEQQYRHAWGKETLERFDRYKVVPISRIAPSDLLFRFVPVRITQPQRPGIGLFKPVRFEFTNVPVIEDIPDDVFLRLEEALKHVRYFTIDPTWVRERVMKLKMDEMVNYTDNVSAEFYRINVRYDAKMENDFELVNWKILHEYDSLYLDMASNLQLLLNALEVLKFNYSWLGDEEKAVEQTVDFMRDVFKTFTIVKEA
ncbi:hypothetical protein [Thermococcus barophilus]|uniref:Uncharacterized protein n=1 Tax=Thermococcus barophilus (strain DSM 11836 / MP) TaxID=391623 RepID=F0LKI5_THEBM|nr:hypothetical protein [Thermococcus barophilus]ADT84819.1 hypothetical protein TERMP_01844 [Thermococcus barophilus MP]